MSDPGHTIKVAIPVEGVNTPSIGPTTVKLFFAFLVACVGNNVLPGHRQTQKSPLFVPPSTHRDRHGDISVQGAFSPGSLPLQNLYHKDLNNPSSTPSIMSNSKHISILMGETTPPATQVTMEPPKEFPAGADTSKAPATAVVPSHLTYLPENGSGCNTSQSPIGLPIDTEHHHDHPNADTAKKWKDCLKIIDDTNRSLVGGWVEDIDTLLLLSGLVAATVTSFNIDSYKWLQQDSGDVHTSLLVHISAQLANSSLPPAVIPTFQPTASAIRINAFWFISLVLSLSVALIGMVTKGWLRHYLNSPQSSSQESAQIRQYRHHSLMKWAIPSIVPWLPLLLQLSLLCFLFGLLDLVLSLNRTVATVTAVTMVIPFLFLVVTTFLIVCFDNYPSPAPYGAILTQIPAFFIFCIFYLSLLLFKLREYRRLSLQNLYRVWVLGETPGFVQESGFLEDHMLVDAAAADEEFMDVVRGRMCNLSTSAALDCLYQIILRRWAWVSFVNAPMYVIKRVTMVMGLVKDVLFREPTGGDVHRVLDVVRLLYIGWGELPREGSDAYQEAGPIYQETFLLLADLLSVHGEDVQREVLLIFESLYERSSISANTSVLTQLISSRSNMRDDVRTTAEILVLKIATEYPSLSVTVAAHLAQEIDSRSGFLDPRLIDALRDFRASRATLPMDADSMTPFEPSRISEVALPSRVKDM